MNMCNFVIVIAILFTTGCGSIEQKLQSTIVYG